MDSKIILEAINKRILDNPFDIVLYEDCFSCIRNIGKENEDKIEVEETHILRDKIRKAMVMAKDRAIPNFSSRLFELNRKCLIYAAPDCFDDFMLALEINRPMQQQFWLPRRKILMPVCNALQELETGELKELFLSLPPRVGKTSTVMFFVLWIMGRNSERTNLYCSFSEKTVNPFYSGILEVLQDIATYSFYDVFPNSKLVSTNANEGKINLDRQKRYASLTCRPIGGSLNGSCDCNGYEIGDDLCSGIEEALSSDRMRSLWFAVENNYIPRALPTAKKLWIGTRWTKIDPQGIRLDLLSNDSEYKDVKWKRINLPALNDKDESNFDYDFGKGFSTGDYKKRRASYERNNDMASWFAQYQGEPIDRDGTVFNFYDLRYFNGILPTEIQPDRIFTAIDPAWGGGDFVAAPFIYQYGNDLYVVDVVYNNSEKNITQPLIVDMIKKYNVQAVKVEGTKMTASYGEDIDKALRKDGIIVNMQINTNHFTGEGKRKRIRDKAPEIRERMIFLSEDKRKKDYKQFMSSLFAFTDIGKQAKNDDAADSLAMACQFAFYGNSKAEIMKRFW